MASERYAFMSAYEKAGVAELAHALLEADYQIIAVDATGQVITDEGLPTTSPLDFLGDPELVTRIAPMEDWAGRDVVADRLAHLMVERAHVLRAAGHQAIDLTYVNPMPPLFLPDGSIKMDTGGLAMIDAAIHGGRVVLTRPSQVESVANELRQQGQINFLTQAELIEDAIVYSQVYTTGVRILRGINETAPAASVHL